MVFDRRPRGRLGSIVDSQPKVVRCNDYGDDDFGIIGKKDPRSLSLGKPRFPDLRTQLPAIVIFGSTVNREIGA